jgi:F-type H+-transporting ATPase subunit a
VSDALAVAGSVGSAANGASTAHPVASGCHIFTGCGYPAPGLGSFDFQPIFKIGSFGFTKPMMICLLVALIVVGFFWFAFGKPKLVPRGAQNVGEMGILFVRDQILRPMTGKKGDKYLPYLVSLFFFIWLMNLMEVIPFFQFPVPSRIGFVWNLVLITWATYMYVGMRTHGVIGFFKYLIPSGVPWWILPLLAPIVLISDIFLRPFTLGVRLFANMFAGHILLLVFYLATWYFLSFSVGLAFAAGSFVMVIVITGFEVLIQFLQAFIFTILTAFYIGDSMSEAH